MTPSHHLRRGPATAVAAVAAVALAAGVTAGCDAAHRALDCVQQAARDAALDPSKARTYFDPIEKNLKGIGHQSDDVDVHKAVDDLGQAVKNVRTSIENGDKSPDLSPLKASAGELTKACTK